MCPPQNQPQEEGAHQTLWGQHTEPPWTHVRLPPRVTLQSLEWDNTNLISGWKWENLVLWPSPPPPPDVAREWVGKFWAQIFPACYSPRENQVKGQVRRSTGDMMVLLSPARSCHISNDTKITGLQRDEVMTSLP